MLPYKYTFVNTFSQVFPLFLFSGLLTGSPRRQATSLYEAREDESLELPAGFQPAASNDMTRYMVKTRKAALNRTAKTRFY